MKTRTPHPLTGSDGFTLIELTAVIAIILTITGVLIPAVQRLREAANRAETTGVLTDLAASLQDFHRSNGRFPDAWETMLNFTKAGDGAVSGYQLIPQRLEAHELLILAEPLAGVTGSEVLALRVTPDAEGTGLTSTPIPGADDARSRMLARLLNFVSQEIAALVYLLPPSDQREMPGMIVPYLDQSLQSPEVIAALTSLTDDGVFSLRSFFDNAGEVAIEDDALRKRFSLLVEGTQGILGLGAFNEEHSYVGEMFADVLGRDPQVADVLFRWDVLTLLTSSFLSDDRGRKSGGTEYQVSQIERELLDMLSRAADADQRGDEALKSRWLAQYIALIVKMEGVLLSKLQTDALTTIANAL